MPETVIYEVTDNRNRRWHIIVPENSDEPLEIWRRDSLGWGRYGWLTVWKKGSNKPIDPDADYGVALRCMLQMHEHGLDSITLEPTAPGRKRTVRGRLLPPELPNLEITGAGA